MRHPDAGDASSRDGECDAQPDRRDVLVMAARQLLRRRRGSPRPGAGSRCLGSSRRGRSAVATIADEEILDRHLRCSSAGPAEAAVKRRAPQRRRQRIPDRREGGAETAAERPHAADLPRAQPVEQAGERREAGLRHARGLADRGRAAPRRSSRPAGVTTAMPSSEHRACRSPAPAVPCGPRCAARDRCRRPAC